MAKASQLPRSILREFAVAYARDPEGLRSLLSALNAAPPKAARATAVPNRQLITVHGICTHTAGYSDPWWEALRAYTQAYGEGSLASAANPGGTRHEVVWSDLVNGSAAKATRSRTARESAPRTEMTAERLELAAEIKGAIRERIHGRQPLVTIPAGGGARMKFVPEGMMTAKGLSIPGLNCIDDFTVYMLDSKVRAEIISRFVKVARPLVENGSQIDVISHSWGTVVAYEALRELDPSAVAGRVRNFFTVGSALSIAPVKWSLRNGNKDGRKPKLVDKWINLNAHGDPVGGHLQANPFEVDAEFLDLPNHGCGWFDFGCAHGSYFKKENVEVNRDVFAAYINEVVGTPLG